MIQKIDITVLKNARNQFEEFRKDISTGKAVSIKAFEFCYELSWRMMKRFLHALGKDIDAPRTIFRAARQI